MGDNDEKYRCTLGKCYKMLLKLPTINLFSTWEENRVILIFKQITCFQTNIAYFMIVIVRELAKNGWKCSPSVRPWHLSECFSIFSWMTWNSRLGCSARDWPWSEGCVEGVKDTRAGDIALSLVIQKGNLSWFLNILICVSWLSLSPLLIAVKIFRDGLHAIASGKEWFFFRFIIIALIFYVYFQILMKLNWEVPVSWQRSINLKKTLMAWIWESQHWWFTHY